MAVVVTLLKTGNPVGGLLIVPVLAIWLRHEAESGSLRASRAVPFPSANPIAVARSVMLAGLPVATPAVHWIALTLRGNRRPRPRRELDGAVYAGVNLIALSLDDRALMLAALEDPPPELAELRAVLLADLLALTIDERAVMLAALEDPPKELSELRAVLLADHQWRRSEGID